MGRSQVWMQSDVPPDFAKKMEAAMAAKKNLKMAKTYSESGWCFVEATMSTLLKQSGNQLDLHLREGANRYDRLKVICQAECAAPFTPQAMEDAMKTKFFTGQGDAKVVLDMYKGFFDTARLEVEELNFRGLFWDDSVCERFAREVLPQFPKCSKLIFCDNQMSERCYRSSRNAPS